MNSTPSLQSKNHFAPLFINENPKSNSSHSSEPGNDSSAIHSIPDNPPLHPKCIPKWEQQLPVKGHLTWMLQFRPLTLVRSMQSLPCSTQGQQDCSLTPNSCNEIAWPHDPWHRLFLCTMWTGPPMSKVQFAILLMLSCDSTITLNGPSSQSQDWGKAK